MSTDNAGATDEIQSADVQPSPTEAPRQKYTVTAESGIFKNGKTYKKGRLIELDELTAKRFHEAGDIDMGEDTTDEN